MPGKPTSEMAVLRAREMADATLLAIAHDAARLATKAYSEVGFPGIGVIVGPKRGTMYPLLVRGDDAQKYARILEEDTQGTDLHSFISGARKRREIKIERKVGEKTYPRGKKTEREGGFYLVVPKVHGTVTRTASGKFEFHGKGGQTLSRSNQDALKQFEARPEQVDFFKNHEDPNMVSEYRTGKVKETFTPVRQAGKVVMDFKVERETAIGNEIFERVKYSQRVRKAGEMEGKVGDSGSAYTRETQMNPLTPRGGQDRANKRGFEAMSALGVHNLRVNSPDANLKEGSDGAKATVQRQKGQVLSFITLSTRGPNKTFGARKGYHILKQASEYIRDRIRDEDVAARGNMGGGFAERAYVEVLESASR